MKKALFVLAAVGTAVSAFADATIVFQQRNNKTASGTGGGNGDGTYNVPIWQDGKIGQSGTGGAGLLAGGVTVGLFLPGSSSPLLNASTGAPATTTMRTDAVNNNLFTTLSQTVNVTGVNPGQTATLEVRAWQGASLAAAQTTAGQQWNIWSFTSQPLGGTPAGGGLPITPPTMQGWGPESGAGLALVTTPEPTTIALGALGVGALLIRRRK